MITSLLANAALAVPWYVPTLEEAEAIEAALERAWPDHSIELRLGEPDGDGVYVEDGLLVLHDGDHVVRHEAVALERQVLLVRSWFREQREREPEEELGWVPPPPAPDPEPVTANRARFLFATWFGVGARVDAVALNLSQATDVGVRVGRVDGFVRVGRSELETARRDGYAGDVSRTGALIGIGWRPTAGSTTLTGALGARLSSFDLHPVPVAPVADSMSRLPEDPQFDDTGDYDRFEARGTVELGVRHTVPMGRARMGGALVVGANPLSLGLGDLDEGWAPFAALSLVLESR